MLVEGTRGQDLKAPATAPLQLRSCFSRNPRYTSRHEAVVNTEDDASRSDIASPPSSLPVLRLPGITDRRSQCFGTLSLERETLGFDDDAAVLDETPLPRSPACRRHHQRQQQQPFFDSPPTTVRSVPARGRHGCLELAAIEKRSSVGTPRPQAPPLSLDLSAREKPTECETPPHGCGGGGHTRCYAGQSHTPTSQWDNEDDDCDSHQSPSCEDVTPSARRRVRFLPIEEKHVSSPPPVDSTGVTTHLSN